MNTIVSLVQPVQVFAENIYIRFHGIPKQVLPLDGSLWRRLINMRIRREQYDACHTSCSYDDFYQHMHSGNFFHCRHDRERTCMSHWFNTRRTLYVPDLQHSYCPVKTVEEELVMLSRREDVALLPMNHG